MKNHYRMEIENDCEWEFIFPLILMNFDWFSLIFVTLSLTSSLFLSPILPFHHQSARASQQMGGINGVEIIKQLCRTLFGCGKFDTIFGDVTGNFIEKYLWICVLLCVCMCMKRMFLCFCLTCVLEWNSLKLIKKIFSWKSVSSLSGHPFLNFHCVFLIQRNLISFKLTYIQIFRQSLRCYHKKSHPKWMKMQKHSKKKQKKFKKKWFYHYKKH